MPGLRATLALAVATQKVADDTLAVATAGETEKEIAARRPSRWTCPAIRPKCAACWHKPCAAARSSSAAPSISWAAATAPARWCAARLAQILPQIYTRFSELPYRLTNEASAVKAALAGNTGNADLAALGVYRADGTLNDSHPLLSALRGRLPLVEQDHAPIAADACATNSSGRLSAGTATASKWVWPCCCAPPACRLIENGQVLTDPASPQVAELLTKEQRFRGLRVQGVRAELSIQDLMQIRTYIETIFGCARPALVAATLNNVLGEQLAAMNARAEAGQDLGHHCAVPAAP